MKKLLSFLAVAAIVTSAFAFTTKGVEIFCVRNAAGNACQIVNNKRIDFLGPQFLHYPLGAGQWDRTVANCVGIVNCAVPINLSND